MAIKCMKNHFDSLEQVNSLREIQALRRSPAPGGDQADRGAVRPADWAARAVFELMDMNIYELIRGAATWRRAGSSTTCTSC